MDTKPTLYTVSGRLLYYLLYPIFVLRPSTRTRGLIFDESGRVLLVKNWIDNNSWDMPGGGVHRAESLPACLSREVYEETGMRIDKSNWLLAGSNRKYFTNFVYFTATIEFEEPSRQKLEIADAQWFYPDALPLRHHDFIDKVLSHHAQGTR